MHLHSDARNRFLLIAAGVVMMVFSGHIDRTLPQFAHIDLEQYRKMALAAPGVAHSVPAPFAYRLLGPYIAGILPIDVDLAFVLLTSLTLLITTLILYDFLRRRDMSPPTAVLVVVLWMLYKHAFGFTAWNSFQIDDILGVLLLIVGYDAMKRGEWGTFAAALVLGMLARETALLLLPTACAFAWETSARGKNLVGIAVGAVLCLATGVVLHVCIPSATTLSLLDSLAEEWTKALSPSTWMRIGINALLPMSVIPMLFWRTTREFFTQHKHLALFVGLVVLSTLFGTDNERLMQPAMFVFYWLLAIVIERYRETMGRAWIRLLISGALLATFSHLCGLVLLPDRAYTFVFSTVALVMVTAGTFIISRRIPTRTH